MDWNPGIERQIFAWSDIGSAHSLFLHWIESGHWERISLLSDAAPYYRGLHSPVLVGEKEMNLINAAPRKIENTSLVPLLSWAREMTFRGAENLKA